MRVVLTGASGQFGSYLLDRCERSGHTVSAWSGASVGRRGAVTFQPIDLTDPSAIVNALDDARPELVLHAAAVSAVDEVRRNPAQAAAVNVTATGVIAQWCASRAARLVFTSTDLVFDGTQPWRREEDPAEPIVAYGLTKHTGEKLVMATPSGLVARLSLLFGPTRAGRPGYFDRTLASLRRGEPQTFFNDEFRTPLDLATAAEALVLLAESSASGLVHVAGRERVSRYDLIRRIAAACGLDPGLVRANRRADVALPEPRPADVSLDTSRLATLLPELVRPTIEEAISRLARDHPVRE